jgi:hypothetical protein
MKDEFLTLPDEFASAPSDELPTIVTLCGSMRFFSQILTVAAEETANGNVVLAPFSVVAPQDQGSEFKSMLDALHRAKIRMAHRVVVVTDQHSYVGESTTREIAYARSLGIEVEFRAVTASDIPARRS